MTARRSTSETRTDSTVIPIDGQAYRPPADDVEGLFRFWCRIMGKPESGPDAPKFTRRKRALIEGRLRDGFTVEQLDRAIEGVTHSDWHMGANAEGKSFTAIEIIFRDVERVEQFLDLHHNPRPDETA